ncbi:MAG: type I deoxyribonuclease HsdR [Saprospiraceae bacterium]|nr:MAG: type I deoxyribonuclease HsdR [Saprospiraceae bacterium]
MHGRLAQWLKFLKTPVPVAPLITFRIIFGLLMAFSTLRFWWLGWIEDHFINTHFTFKYFGFEWVQLLPPEAMYALHGLMFIGAIGITLGLYYRWSALLFFLTFTYVELVDLTYYLNHYYFVSLVSLLLIVVPANCYFSLDVYFNPKIQSQQVPRWAIDIFKWQIGIVYIFAGIAKINTDWLIHALPLKIWLPPHSSLPLIGPVFNWEATAYLFSWFALFYDLFIVFFLVWKPTRLLAYLSVVLFHCLTGLLFPIGIFPLVMIGGTWIFFPESFHQKLLDKASNLFKRATFVPHKREDNQKVAVVKTPKYIAWILSIYFLIQLLLPWRYLLYPGNLFWTEEGYRYSWRVMLVEKAGTATFYVKDSRSGREGVVNNREFLREQQERLMAYQPDMILQFAHFLAEHYEREGVYQPQVRAEVYVTMNGRPSNLLIDPEVNLAAIKDSWRHKEWIIIAGREF